jgi:hypothetical protein
MTREEFILGYCERSKISVTPYMVHLGYVKTGILVLMALPCACGDDICEGWAMVNPEMLDTHMAFSAPQDLREIWEKYNGPF